VIAKGQFNSVFAARQEPQGIWAHFRFDLKDPKGGKPSSWLEVEGETNR